MPSRAALAVLACLVSLLPARAADRRQHTAARAASPVRVDGVLDEPAWAAAARIALTHEWAPGDNTPPPVETTCLVTFDDDNLYVAFDARDPQPALIRAQLAERDTPFLDDTVGFMLDTFNDRRRAFQFRVNALGVQMDGINSDVDDSEDWSWDAIWESAGRVTATGFVVEAAIPFRQLRFPAEREAPAAWGFLALRDYPRAARHRLRSTAYDHALDCLVCQFESLSGIGGISRGLNLELDPTLTASRDDVRPEFPDGPLVAGDEDVEAGLTARWGVGTATTLLGTLNPDFSQVEADAAQLAVNERFALFFPEKRPFFLEGVDYFGTPLDIVFTRTIADPEWGAKVTGKEAGAAFGALVARDDINNLVFPAFESSSSTSLDDEVTTGVLRYRRDVGETSTLGVLYTGRSGTDYDNHVVGIDGRVALTSADTLRFQLLGSQTRYPDDVAADAGQPLGAFGGGGGYVEYRHASRDWNWGAWGLDLHPRFRADTGFVPQVDIRQGEAWVTRTFRGGGETWYDRLELSASVDATRDHAGTADDRGADAGIYWQGRGQTEVSFTLSPNKESFEGVSYDNFRQSLFVSTRPTRAFAAELELRNGEAIDYTNSQEGDFFTLAPEIELHLGRRLMVEAEYVRQWFDVAGGELFDAVVAQGRILFHFTPRTFVRGILQHRDVRRNPALYSIPVPGREQDFFGQFLFSYRLDAQTVVLAGYSEDQSGLDAMDPVTTGRTFFLKLGYALLL